MSVNGHIKSVLKESDTTTHAKIETLEKQVLFEYRKALTEIQSKMKYIEDKYQNFNDLYKYKRLQNIETQLFTVLLKLGVRFDNFTRKAISDIYSQTYNKTGFALESALQTNLGYGVIDGRAVESALSNEYQLIKWKDASFRNVSQSITEVRSAITQGMLQQKTFAQTTTEIANRINVSASKSVRIVRTESHRAHNSARLDAFDNGESAVKELKLNAVRRWIATLDNRTRTDHAHLDGKSADENGFFYFDGGKTKAPVHSGIASEDINCRCTLSLELVGMNAMKRRVKGEGVVDYQTFDKWKESKLLQAPKQAPKIKVVKAPAPVKVEVPVVAERVLDSTIGKAKTVNEAKADTLRLMKRVFPNAQENVTYAQVIDVEKANRMNIHLEKLLNEYEPTDVWRKTSNVKISMRTERNAYGYIEYFDSMEMTNVNFGSMVDETRTSLRGLSAEKSFVDAKNLEVSTMTHEFGHLLGTEQTSLCSLASHREMKEFYKEIKTIFVQYKNDIYLNQRLGSEVGVQFLHDNYLGQRAGHNINEFVAESFANYKLSSKPSKYAVEVGKAIDKYFKRK